MFKFLKMASTVSLCAAMIMVVPTAQASIMNFNFNGTIDSGLLIGETYNGSFAFDNATLANLGNESIDLSSLTFNFLSSAYNLANADFTPTADFLDGLFLGVNYSVSSSEPSFAFVSGFATGLPADAYFSYQTVAGDSGFGSFNISAVPVPAAFWLFGTGLGLLSFTRRKNQK
jgi:hypothetical protein